MAVAVSEFSSWISNNNASAYTCMANITLPTNQLLICFVRTRAASNLTHTAVTGCGLTWNSVDSVKYNTTFAQLSLWTARGTPSTGTIHVACSGTMQNCAVTMLQCTGESGTLVQSATTKSDAAVSTLTAILSAFSGAGNATAVGWSKISATENILPRTPTTVIVSRITGTGSSTDAGQLASSWSVANVTDSAMTSATANPCAGIACEINVAAAGGTVFPAYYTAHYYPQIVMGVA